MELATTTIVTRGAALAIATMVIASCGSGGTEDVPSSGSPDEGANGYCATVESAAAVLDAGGSDRDYHELLRRAAAEGPAAHADTWQLMRTLSEEPFDYDNFNSALDSLDRITPSLDAMCAGLDAVVVDDDGRLRMLTPD